MNTLVSIHANLEDVSRCHSLRVTYITFCDKVFHLSEAYSQHQGFICLHLFSHKILSVFHYSWVFYAGLRGLIQVLMFVRQAVSLLSHFLSSQVGGP